MPNDSSKMIKLELLTKPTVIIDGKKKTFKKWEDALIFAFKKTMTSVGTKEISVVASKRRFKELQKMQKVKK